MSCEKHGKERGKAEGLPDRGDHLDRRLERAECVHAAAVRARRRHLHAFGLHGKCSGLRCPPRPLLPLHPHSPPQADSGLGHARSRVAPVLMSVTYFHDLDPQIHQNLCWTQSLQSALMKSDFDLHLG